MSDQQNTGSTNSINVGIIHNAAIDASEAQWEQEVRELRAQPGVRLEEIVLEIARGAREQAPEITSFPVDAVVRDYTSALRTATKWICYAGTRGVSANPATAQLLLMKWVRVDAGQVDLRAKSISDLRGLLWAAMDDISRCLHDVDGPPKVKAGAVLPQADPVQ